MKKRNMLPMSLAFVAIAFLTLTSFTSPRWISGGRVWFAAGSQPADYDMGVTSPDPTGFKCAFIKSKVAPINGFGTYMQESGTDGYLGKSVRMTGWIMSKNVTDWAGMWFRVDGPNPMKSLSFDNMQDRPIKGYDGLEGIFDCSRCTRQRKRHRLRSAPLGNWRGLFHEH